MQDVRGKSVHVLGCVEVLCCRKDEWEALIHDRVLQTSFYTLDTTGRPDPCTFNEEYYDNGSLPAIYGIVSC